MAKRLLFSGEFQNLKRSCQTAVNPGAGEGMSAADLGLLLRGEGGNEDVLLEILARLPNSRNAIHGGLVCHLWHSLISQQQFIPRFIGLREQKKKEQPYSIIFRMVDVFERAPDEYYRPICNLFSEESMVLHGGETVTSCRSYPPSGSRGGVQPPSPNMVIGASCGDLLLLSQGERYYKGPNSHYLCNPVTKQWLHLPDVWFGDFLIGFAVVRMPPTRNSSGSYEYKVVFIHFPHDRGDNDFARLGDSWKFQMSIYCSKSRKWNVNSWFRYPVPTTTKTPRLFINPITCNGTIYWFNCDVVPDYVIACDLANNPHSTAFIDLPEGSLAGGGSVVSLELGAVQGELRLFNVFCPSSRDPQQPLDLVVVKVWELNHRTNSWTLVHDTCFNDRPPPNGMQVEEEEEEEEENKFNIRTVAFHPHDGDVVFLVCGCGVFRYHISRGVYEKVDELCSVFRYHITPQGVFEKVDELLHSVPPNELLTSFTLLHSIWPNTMLLSPSE
ncbi:unnamed protein product [Cuscuta epithymum]|uniref:F-box protein At3g26010-like beta-propeller domain-containing protein n=1 Tax=Cuscuta epithymum TaxID=186058 RepID=A0AAV0G858_9ASTE|nr:unnamed protein product [Cuscuta epithymum]